MGKLTRLLPPKTKSKCRESLDNWSVPKEPSGGRNLTPRWMAWGPTLRVYTQYGVKGAQKCEI